MKFVKNNKKLGDSNTEAVALRYGCAGQVAEGGFAGARRTKGRRDRARSRSVRARSATRPAIDGAVPATRKCVRVCGGGRTIRRSAAAMTQQTAAANAISAMRSPLPLPR